MHLTDIALRKLAVLLSIGDFYYTYRFILFDFYLKT